MTTRRTVLTAAMPLILGFAVVAMLVVTWRAQAPSPLYLGMRDG